ncbi:hypothetical protein [Cardinium endosymbiont of Culicoides punctatus]|uniref:hypothetical protein n=1 Tax=Cardinium endosymbiont of Culicoides punctatus TaxID=2304601 RepID=UPI001058CB8E|nr:hypothetical protein [Cardinium endosymbiont of Culicoides punctatus]
MERAYFNKNGSGGFSLKVDLTKIGKLISVIKYINKDYQHITKIIGYNIFSAAEQRLKKIDGISDIRLKQDKAMLKFTIKFAFENIKVLNKAVDQINKGLDPTNITYFSFSDELFVREDVNGIAKKLLLYKEHDNCLVNSLDLAFFFRDSTYTTIYTFPNKIVDFSNPFSELTEDKKTIGIAHHIFAIGETDDSISNRIHFENNN